MVANGPGRIFWSTNFGASKGPSFESGCGYALKSSHVADFPVSTANEMHGCNQQSQLGALVGDSG